MSQHHYCETHKKSRQSKTITDLNRSHNSSNFEYHLKMKIILLFVFIFVVSYISAAPMANQKFQKATLDSALWTPNPALKKVKNIGTRIRCIF